jgi:hypothetical protein
MIKKNVLIHFLPLPIPYMLLQKALNNIFLEKKKSFKQTTHPQLKEINKLNQEN